MSTNDHQFRRQDVKTATSDAINVAPIPAQFYMSRTGDKCTLVVRTNGSYTGALAAGDNFSWSTVLPDWMHPDPLLYPTTNNEDQAWGMGALTVAGVQYFLPCVVDGADFSIYSIVNSAVAGSTGLQFANFNFTSPSTIHVNSFAVEYTGKNIDV